MFLSFHLLLLTGCGSARGVTPPASSSSSVAWLVFSDFPSPSVDYGLFHFLMSALSRPTPDPYRSEREYLNRISPVSGVLGTFSVCGRRFVIFLSVDWNCLCILWNRYFGSVGCHGGVFLVAGLCYSVFTVFLHYLLSVISNQWDMVSWSFPLAVTDIYGMCVFHVCAALRRRGRRRSWRLGKLCTIPGLSPLGPESFAGTVVLTVGSWRLRRYCAVSEHNHAWGTMQ